jgi:RNA polymerase sigma factor (sigma-70 family)
MTAFSDSESFRPFVEEHFAALASFARSLLGSDMEAEDLAQEALVRLYRARARLDPRRSPRAYAYRIVFRLSLSRLRRESRRRSLALLFAPLARRQAPPPSDPLDAWFATLTERQRAIAHLHFAEDLDASEIAARLSIRPATVRVQLMRIRRALQSAAATSPIARRCSDVP